MVRTLQTMPLPSTKPVRSMATDVDIIARETPDAPWVFVPRNDKNLGDGYKAITFGELSKAVDKMSRWIETNIGLTHTREVIAFMDRSNDIRYTMAILAAMKTGYKILLTSTRNSVEGQRHLLQSTHCVKFMHGAESKADVESIRDDNTQFQSYEIPSLVELLKGDAEPFPGKVSHNPAKTAIIIHTSGSTGLPKPIELKNGYVAGAYVLAALEGRPHMAEIFFGNSVSLCTLPFFHAMGLFSIVKSIFGRGPLVLPPIGRLPTAEMNLEMIKAAKPNVAFFPPSILEDLVDLPGGMEALSTFDFVMFAGAPLAQKVGDRVSKVTRIQTVIGSTEAGILDSYINEDPADWMYFDFCPWTSAVMEESDGLHELVIKRKGDGLQGAFYSFPELLAWRTKDLYEQHPTKPHLWQYRGRNDDIIVLSNGEKFNPVAFEKFVEGHPQVKGAMVSGQGRFQASLVLELSKEQDLESFIEEIWPIVERANAMTAAHGRVWKSKIAFARPGKHFVRSPKGSIVRRASNDAFKEEIDALYSNEGFADQLGQLDGQASEATVKRFVLRAVHLTMPNIPKDIEDTADIFAYGVDSLQVLGLSSAISHAMPKDDGVRDSAIKSRVIYANPTIESLTQTVFNMLNGGGASKAAVSREQKMAETVNKYTATLPSYVGYNPRQEKHAVILTGSTGSLGNYLLEYLIAAPNVAKIYCLNRSDAEARQRRTFEERGATPDFAKVKFLQTSFDKEQFGLSTEVYRELEATVDIFIHNAWAVDFNMGLESFEDTHVAGTRRCVDFSASAQYHPHIIFISSIASTGNWLGSGHSGLVPEYFIGDDNLPLPQGYGESKHVAGRILAAAAEKSGIASSIVRVGQLAGPNAEKGLWNKQEWLPSIIASSKAIGKIPRTLGNEDVVDWVPVDDAARVLMDLGRTRLSTQAEQKLDVFHLVNPNIVSWSQLVPAVQNFYAATGTQIEPVEFVDWIKELKSLPMTQETMTKVPGLKLLDFYDGLGAPGGGLPRMDTKHTAESSVTLRELGPVDEGMIGYWLRQWNF